MNWDINRKITAFGNDENIYYKRLYFTENLNAFRGFNLKDVNLPYRRAIEFGIQQFSPLLRPEIYSVNTDGQLKAMSVQYSFRLITENGAVTSFSPFSRLVKIVKDNTGTDFEGAFVGDKTNKSVTVNCNIPNPKNFKEVELVAITYETDSTPSDIISLGKQPVQEVVTFIHRGNEALFNEVITLEDLLDYKNSWKYCNTLTAKDNKLIVGGLRNEPYPFDFQTVEDLFLLRGWDSNGNTHSSYLINPQPYIYKYIDPKNTDDFIHVQKRLFTSFIVFGDFTISLKGLNTTETKSFTSSTDEYKEYIDEVYTWLTTLTLTTNFPGLTISRVGNNILFALQDTDITNDILNYEFLIDTKQSVILFENEYKLFDPAPTISNLVEGAVSYGFNNGNGVRLSWRETKEKVLNKANVAYTSGPVLDLETPTLLKSFMKDEIYRLSIQLFKNGQPLFAIVLGDIQAPKLGDTVKYIDDNGSPIKTAKKYVNQSIDSTSLYAHRLQLKVEVRMNAFLNDFVDSYQIQYVKRDENNRTVLAQGLSAPLIRMAKSHYPNLVGSDKVPDVFRKWTLPFMGGPTYPRYGLEQFDVDENFDEHFPLVDKYTSSNYNTNDTAIKKRLITNRRMFYFDSPDFIYGLISTDNLINSRIDIVGAVKTDHSRAHIRDNQDIDYPKFSRKIQQASLSGNEDDIPYFVNVSVFSNYISYFKSHNIEKHTKLLSKGQVISSGALGTNFEASNNAMSLSKANWFYSDLMLNGHHANDKQLDNEFLQSAQVSEGYPTVFIRTEDNVFTNELIGTNEMNVYSGVPHGDDHGPKPINDTHAIINLKLKNLDGIYGGRSKYAFSKNVFQPLSEVIPLYDKTNQAQKTIIDGDSYVSLFLRTKNDYSGGLVDYKKFTMRNSPDKKSDGNSVEDWNRGSAWAYAVVLETQVESRLTENFRFYKSTSGNDFGIENKETVNPAYLKEDDLRIFSPKPHDFKDDPLLLNILAASKVKLNGDFYDSWTEFPVNEFYELSLDKGAVTNVTTFQDEVFAIQERETNLLKVSGVDFVNTQDGNAVSIKRSEGTSFLIHKKVHDYGTSFRRNLVETPFGFAFFDEHKIEFIFNHKPLLIANNLQLEIKRLLGSNTIIDIEGFYDEENKDINFILSLSDSTSLCISYNIPLKVFNGIYDYDNSVFINFDNKVFKPRTLDNTKLEQLNIGNYMEFDGVQKTLKLKIAINKDPNSVKIFKATSVFLNTTYGIKKIILTDNNGNTRTMLPTHSFYKIREGKHSVPFLNVADNSYLRDYVGTVEYEIESQSNKKVTIFSIVNHLRKSFV